MATKRVREENGGSSDSKKPRVNSPEAPPQGAWDRESWRKLPIKQQPTYADTAKVDAAVEKLKVVPPLVHPVEILRLKKLLAEVAKGERFLIQGGDCAERFMDCKADTIEAKLKIILQMSLIVTWIGKLPTLRIARIAGQYAKPRSSNTEVVEGKEVKSFRGDSINSFDPNDREHDPDRLVQSYFHSASTLNYLRATLASGFADLHHSSHWDLRYVKDLARRKEYENIADRLVSALEFLDTVGAGTDDVTKTVDFFTSHEGLVLEYESALTRSHHGRNYNVGAHFLWIGDRTRQLDGAHIEYFRGIFNPIGVKSGPTTDPEEMVQLIRRLNPTNEVGKIIVITRFGAGKVEKLLPPVIKAVQKAGLNVVWQCDPCHGNTEKTSTGVKTRNFENLLSELTETFKIHRTLGSHLGGVHFELTGENVTECIGGPQGLKESDLSQNYTSYCDPRLNYAQSMEMAFRMSDLVEKSRSARVRKRSISQPVAEEDILGITQS